MLIQNCYLAVSLGLQPKKSLDEYAAQGVGQTKTGKALYIAGWRYDLFTRPRYTN